MPIVGKIRCPMEQKQKSEVELEKINTRRFFESLRKMFGFRGNGIHAHTQNGNEFALCRMKLINEYEYLMRTV